MSASYVVDSNVFIGLQRRQPIDLYPSVWNKISELMETGVIVSSREVYDELALGGDDLAKWAQARQEFFLPSEIEIQMRFELYSLRIEGWRKVVRSATTRIRL